MIRKILLAATLLSVAACDQNKSFERDASGITVTPQQGQARKVRLEVVDERIIHVTAFPSGKTELQPSLMTVAKPSGQVKFEVDEEAGNGSLRLRTAKMSAEISRATGAVAFFDATGKPLLAETDSGRFSVDGKIRQQFNPGTDEAFYGLGQHQNSQVDLNGEDVVLAQHNMDIAVPFLISSRDYGLLWDNNSITHFGAPDDEGVMNFTTLTAKYYDGDALKLERSEQTIDYQYIRDLARWPAEVGGSREVQEKRGTKNQHVVWEGDLSVDRDGPHKFQLYASGYFKVTVDGEPVLDGWRQSWNPWYHNFTLPMSAGKTRHIRIDWTPEGGFIALLHGDPLPEDQRHELSLASDVAQAIDYYVVAGTSMDDVIAGYRTLTGKAVLLPRWAYGLWQSRQRYKSQAEILDTVAEFRKRGLPLDNIVEDWFYWPEDSWGSHEFDKSRFPDPKAMLDTLHGEHAHFMISVWPKFYPTTDNYKELDAKGFIYRRNVEVGERDWVGKGYTNAFYDPYSAEARGLYWRQIKDKLDVLGVDGWWLDASEPDTHSNLDMEERIRRMGPTALGPAAAFFNSYPLLHTQAVYDGFEAAHPDTRSFILTRSGFAGLQRNGAASWSGDVASRWADLKNQIPAGLGFSMSGIPNWTTDIGGFALEKRYSTAQPKPEDLDEWRELNTRWFQFGAFSPLFRSHGEYPYREIFNLAPEGSEVYRTLAYYDHLRYRLMPYIYTVAADTWFKDGSIMRAPVMDFPSDPALRDLKDQFLFGHALLVSPVTDYKARSRTVVLPAGADWYDFYSGEKLTGGQSVKVDAPLSRIPLHVRAGTILPIGPDIQYTGEKPDAPLTLAIYRGADGLFSLYEDDGVSNGYKTGAFSRIPIRYDEASGILTLGDREGTFPGLVDKRVFRLHLVSGKDAKAASFDETDDGSVTYDGHAQQIKVTP